VTTRRFRNAVVPAVGLAVGVWIVFRDRGTGSITPYDVRMAGLLVIMVLVTIVPIVVLSRVPQIVRPRSLRRLMVAVAYAGFLIYGCTWVFASTAGVSFAAVHALGFGIVALLLGALALCVVFVWNRNMYDSLSGTIDERIIVRRNETLAIAFQVLALACAIEGVMWFARASIALPKTVDFPSLFLATDLLLIISLPAAILAWGDPDTVED
jgi:hypothetical protein